MRVEDDGSGDALDARRAVEVDPLSPSWLYAGSGTWQLLCVWENCLLSL
jgi:hypothetical protein